MITDESQAARVLPQGQRSILVLLVLWLMCMGGAAAAYFSITPRGPEGKTFGLNRAVPVIACVTLAWIVALATGFITRRNRKNLTPTIRSLGYLPTLLMLGTIGAVVHFIITGTWLFLK